MGKYSVLAFEIKSYRVFRKTFVPFLISSPGGWRHGDESSRCLHPSVLELGHGTMMNNDRKDHQGRGYVSEDEKV